MAKDYAKYPFKTQPKLVEHGWRNRLLFVILLISFLCCVGYGFYLYKHNTNPSAKNVTAWFSEAKEWVSHKKPPQDNSRQLAKIEQPTQEQEVQFHFYTDLSTMQVMPDTANGIKMMPSRAKELDKSSLKEQYVLQIGTYQNEALASEARISLLLAGYEMDLLKSEQNNQMVYVLQKGPFGTMAEAKTRQQQLKKKGFESVVIKMN